MLVLYFRTLHNIILTVGPLHRNILCPKSVVCCSPFVKKLINKFDFEALDTKIEKSKVIIATKSMHTFVKITTISRVPVDGKSSVCLICMKYRIIILIIIVISLGQIVLSYIANTSRTHARTHAHACTRTHAHTHTAVAAVQVIAIHWRPTVTARSAGDNAGRWPLK